MTTQFAICIPYYSHYEAEHRQCVEALAAETHMPLITVHGNTQIDIARSQLVALAARQEPFPEVILFIDHDTIFETKDALSLVESAKERGIVGAMYSQRTPRGKVVGALDLSQGSVPCFEARGAGLYKAHWLGMGFTAIDIRVFQTMSMWQECQPVTFSDMQVIPCFRPMIDEKRRYLGEDISFCYRAHQLGYTCWIDTRIRVGHKGSYVYHVENCFSDVEQDDYLVIYEE